MGWMITEYYGISIKKALLILYEYEKVNTTYFLNFNVKIIILNQPSHELSNRQYKDLI